MPPSRGCRVVAGPVIGPPRHHMSDSDANLLVASGADVGLIGIQRCNLAYVPLAIGSVLQPHHAETSALQPVIGASFIL